VTSLSLRALGVFPCGACRALVDEQAGCEHQQPEQPQGISLARLVRIPAGGVPAQMLDEATRSTHGVVRAAGDRARSQAGRRLINGGLMEIVAPGVYRITATGRAYRDAIFNARNEGR